VKSSTAHHQSKVTLVVLKNREKRKLEGEGALAPEQPSLPHLLYGNSTELRPPL